VVSRIGARYSVARGYRVDYLLDAVAKEDGIEADGGERPGIWTGRGCPALGLPPGGEIEPGIMRRLYSRLLDPRDPAFFDDDTPDPGKKHLGTPPRAYKTIQQHYAELTGKEPNATPERLEELEIEARRKHRTPVNFFDYTFSVDKSTSLLHAALESAALQAEKTGNTQDADRYRTLVELTENAIMDANQAALEYMQDEAGYSRAGHHGALPKDADGRPIADHPTGKFVDAHRWIIGSFFQRTNRNGDPQLHVHNPLLNRVECGDGTWRTLDSRALYRIRAAASAIGGRVLDERMSQVMDVVYEQRPDLRGRELRGFPGKVLDLYSSRRAVVTKGVAELAAAYESKHGRPPHARALWAMAQFVTLDSRKAKPNAVYGPNRTEMLEAWEQQMREAELGALADIPARVIGTRSMSMKGIAALADDAITEILQASIADLQSRRETWNRTHLLASIDAHLPGWLGGLDSAAVRRTLEDLTSQALDGDYGIVSLEAPDAIPFPERLLRPDGRSVYSPRHRDTYTTRGHLEAETALVGAAGPPHPGTSRNDGWQTAPPQAGQGRQEPRQAPSVTPETAAEALGISIRELAALPGRIRPGDPGPAPADDPERSYGGLRPDQAGAVAGIMTSGRHVDVLIGPAGSGKSRTMGQLAALWETRSHARVVGVTAAENAARVLAGEGVPTAYNISRFLRLAAENPGLLHPGDLLIVDEASMVPTSDLTALHSVVRAAGAKMVLVGDPQQLPAVGAGGMLGTITRRHGRYQLTQVQRMQAEWERAASLRLRDGDTSVLSEYDKHGRLAQGTAEEMTGAAYRAWLADHLSGLDSLLITPTNELAADLSARARSDLADLGKVDQHAPVRLSDGNRAGRGDIIQARTNDRRIRDREGRWVANRDILQIEDIVPGGRHGGAPSGVRARLQLEPDPGTGAPRWSEPFTIPAAYLRESAVLGYAGTAHSVQGRDADTAHSIIPEAMTRSYAYVSLSRARTANYAYIPTENAEPPRARRGLADEPPRRARAADLNPEPRPAPALEQARAESGAAANEDPPGPWAPEADRFTVMAGVLNNAGTSRTALDVQADETARAAHMAHLGPIWVQETAEASATRCDAILSRILTPAQYQRYQGKDARTTLARLVRACELAGRDPEQLLARAVALYDLDNDPNRGRADDIAKTLHWRIKTVILQDRDPEPRTGQSFTERTPRTGDPGYDQWLRTLAGRLDQRARELGEHAASRPPQWALDRLGPVPAEPEASADWTRRAAHVAAYREQYSWTDPARPAGPEPEGNDPETHLAWRTATDALGTDPARAELEAADDKTLYARRARWERELQWSPPHVARELRTTALALRENETAAALARARSETTAGAYDQIVSSLRGRVALLTEIDQQRARWHEETTGTREAAENATAELERRQNRQLPTYRDPHQPPEDPGHQDPPGDDAQRPETRSRRDMTADDINRAAEQAALARQIIDARQQRRAEDRARRSKGPRPSWPHHPSRRPPGPRRDGPER